MSCGYTRCRWRCNRSALGILHSLKLDPSCKPPGQNLSLGDHAAPRPFAHAPGNLPCRNSIAYLSWVAEPSKGSLLTVGLPTHGCHADASAPLANPCKATCQAHHPSRAYPLKTGPVKCRCIKTMTTNSSRKKNLLVRGSAA